MEDQKMPMEDLISELKDLESKVMNHPAYGVPYDWSARDFELGPAIGRGCYGRVHIAREKISGLIVAIKIMFKSQINCEKQILREIEIHSRLKHPNILRLYTWFHDEKRIYLVMEYAIGGELMKHLTEAPDKRFPEAIAAKYIYQIVDAVEFCHQNDVMHRDIKPENILVSDGGDLKLADFGWSVHAPSRRRETICGTMDYLPPEMILGKAYDVSVDHWCIGVLLYEFLVGTPPFLCETADETYEKIVVVDMEYPDYVPEGAKDLISKLLRHSGNDRLSLNDVKNHPWVQKFRTNES